MSSTKYTKQNIIKKLQANIKIYNENLLNKIIMFTFENKQNKRIEYIEVLFKNSNFMHLTGIKYKYGATRFFNDCKDNRLLSSNMRIEHQGLTALKLEVLESAMAINKSAKRIGTYNDNKSNIKIERVIGNMHCWIGFSNLKQNNEKMKYYYPKTLIQDDFRKNVTEENKIIAILSKNKNDKLYNEITYLSKNTTLARLKEENQIFEKIDYENLKSKSPQYQKRIEEEIKQNLASN